VRTAVKKKNKYKLDVCITNDMTCALHITVQKFGVRCH